MSAAVSHDRGGDVAHAGAIALRTPVKSDGPAIWQLVHDTGVLEPNTAYAYMLLSSHFADTCVVAERDGALLGFVAAYRPPTHPEAVFVWQIGVLAAARGEGLAKRMLHHVVDLPACREVTHLEATVEPSNAASRRLFRAFARERGVPCDVGPGFDADDFAPLAHEPEVLFRIGPLRSTQK